MDVNSHQVLTTAIRRVILKLRASSAKARVHMALRQTKVNAKYGYDPGQPRRRDGTAQSGWWAGAADDIDRIVAAAKRIHTAAFSQKYSDCVDLCYPILERPPRGDFNLWDFHKCLNRCLGRNL